MDRMPLMYIDVYWDGSNEDQDAWEKIGTQSTNFEQKNGPFVVKLHKNELFLPVIWDQAD